jgi:RNA polymerase sigma-70 factor (ECF subfamily)
MGQDDAALLARWREGDLVSGEALCERYYDKVERFFLNKVSASVGDLVQETFTVCVENHAQVRDAAKFRSYLFAVAYNVLCAHLRRHYRKDRAIDFDRVSAHDVSPSPSSLAVRHREQRLLLEGLRNIPVDYQVVLELHYWEEMTTADIAEVLHIPVGTVRSRMRRAREMLEDAMTRLTGSPELLESTKTHLEDWAHKCRSQLG